MIMHPGRPIRDPSAGVPVTSGSARVPVPPDVTSEGRLVARVLGRAAVPGRVLPLTTVLVVTALAAVVAGAATAATPVPAPGLPVRAGIAAAVVALAQFGRLRQQRRGSTLAVTWGEAALIVGLWTVPAGWLPAATFVGAAVAWLLLSGVHQERSAVEIAHGAASLTLGVTAGAAVVTAIWPPFAAAPTPPGAAALLLGCLAYYLVTCVLAALTLSLTGDGSFGRLLLQAIGCKAPMFVGNVAVGLAVVLTIAHESVWLVLLPPVLWLLHSAYRRHLRADDEHRTWEIFARATHDLARPDERQIAEAGLRGVREILDAERAELDVLDADGAYRRYAIESPGAVVETAFARRPRPPADATAFRDLAVGDVSVGQLALWLPRPRTPSPREQLALSAYADAVGTALHDAANRERLDAVIERCAYEARHDALTGLANRPALLADGDVVVRGLDRDHLVGLLLFDLNDFKSVNGTLGHCAGDELLRVIAARLSDLTRDGELLARLGDDEFALLVHDIPVLSDSKALHDTNAPMVQALRRARDIADRLRHPIRVAGVQLVVETSVGVVVAPAGEADIAELVRRGEVAMEQVKATGGGVGGYENARDTASTDHLVLLAELRDALAADDQLVLELQPEVDLGTGSATGVEALIRWQHPRRGLLQPSAFIREVEHSELLGAFTRYVLDRSVAAAAAWVADGVDVPVSVNLSARSLLDPTLPAQIIDVLRRHRLPVHRLVLEITETVAVSENTEVDDVLAAVRAAGVQLSVDDFGTGYSSLAFLARVPVDEIKVDREFVGRMMDKPEAAAIVRSTIHLGRGLNLRVVAEGVETADQRTALMELGCTAAQGYHFCRPLPVDKIGSALRSLGRGASARVVPLRADGAS